MVKTAATRAETVADQIRQAIKDGQYMGGERLIEQTLAGQMNVSQNTIRDALRILWRVLTPAVLLFSSLRPRAVLYVLNESVAGAAESAANDRLPASRYGVTLAELRSSRVAGW